ncbi:Uncharacterized protein dnm_054390 [Desulfonema magnum]|uniref:Uncharacterized protein n=1 Tax=Desulfonema magnum TaxID=45655 RepID=A0A975BQ96_9BACT|nr:Uncharacterized protein dnm_054390 [Desulfonema magnum]
MPFLCLLFFSISDEKSVKFSDTFFVVFYSCQFLKKIFFILISDC